MVNMNFYIVVLIIAIVVASYLSLKRQSIQIEPAILQKQRIYLVVYTCAYFSDWLKGPYLYKLYESRGMTENEMIVLFCAGFGSSAIAGPFVGMLADGFGRKKMCIAYFVMYIISALLTIQQNFVILFLGRLLAGIGTSLLCTVFESWMVSNFKRNQYSQELLEDTLSKSTTYNSMSAIAAGIVAQIAVEYLGYDGPVLIAIVPLACGMLICYWGLESDHDQTSTVNFGFQGSLRSMNINVWIICMTQSIFLATMYIFVFLWTPALESPGLPHGFVFSTFMVMISIGAQIYRTVAHRLEFIPYWILFSTAAVMIGIVAAKDNTKVLFLIFCMFEFICGVMFPTYGALRSVYIEEEHRTTVMNIFRIPLNVFVVILLLNKRNLTISQTFGICAVVNVIAGFVYYGFVPNRKMNDFKLYRAPDTEEEFGILEDIDELESNTDSDTDSDTD
jgi:MFS family permease